MPPTDRRSRWRGRALWLLLAGFAIGAFAVAAGGADNGGDVPQPPPAMTTPAPPLPAPRRALAPIERLRVGRGAASAIIVHRDPLDAERRVVVFLHGWGVNLKRYRPWINHLVRRGSTVVAPRYQTSPQSPPAGVRSAAVAGVRRALARLVPADDALVLVGHSAGGALAADIAAVSARGSLPRALAIFAVYPGRAILGYPGGIPALPLRRLPRATRLVALAGADDLIVGQAPAQQLVAAATALPRSHRDYRLITDPRVDDHFAPTRRSSSARRVFWRRLDRLMETVQP